ncbi:hypothetical protein [Pedobacter rhodius]|uniref:Lipoprotein n=1 Tax=Pedobacter rhodius TaxID=3004098 RepID=A0ABT4KU71_9SPHI|nr:hypothetical protein [Pedobacter sp. SJ11]MCZ4222374.1 hypothetical protein [Pedobacter sp. SJ11]
MRKIIIVMALAASATFGCSGNKADKENADSMYQYTDTNKATVDTTGKDSVNTKGFPDSTTNAPRMPGGEKKME